MKKWVLKAVVQKAISYLPFSNNINYIFQKYVTKGVFLNDDYFYDRLQHAAAHLHYYTKHTGKPTPETALELGTGWYPVVPVSFFLCGTAKIYTVDITLLTNKERIKTTVHRFMEAHDKGILQKQLPIHAEKFQQLKDLLNQYDSLTFDEIVNRLHITYLIEDARNLSLADDTIDLVNSNNTFEHIYPKVLGGILKDFKRIVKKDSGIQSHFIDMSDHFAHFDKSISIYNFLKFSDKQWHFIDNDIQPQSRLRYNEYKHLYKQLDIPVTEETFRAGDINALKKITLAKKYQSMPAEEVAISHCHFVSK